MLLTIVVEKVTNLYNLFHARVHGAKRRGRRYEGRGTANLRGKDPRRVRVLATKWEGGRDRFSRRLFSVYLVDFSATIGRYYLPDKPASPLVPLSPGSPFGPGRPRTPLANVTPLSPLKPYNDTARSDPTRSSMCSVNFVLLLQWSVNLSSFREEGEEERMVPWDLRRWCRSILALHID